MSSAHPAGMDALHDASPVGVLFLYLKAPVCCFKSLGDRSLGSEFGLDGEGGGFHRRLLSVGFGEKTQTYWIQPGIEDCKHVTTECQVCKIACKCLVFLAY